MKLNRGFCKNDNDKEKIKLDKEIIKGRWIYWDLFGNTTDIKGNHIDKFEIIKACKEHFEYNDIIDERREIIDWGSIVEFIYSKIGQRFFEEVARGE